MVRWHHWLNEHEFEQAPGDTEGQGSHRVPETQIWLSDFTFTFHFHALEKETATHSSVLAWRIPGTGEPGGLPSMGSYRVSHNWSDLAAAAAAASESVLSMNIQSWFPLGLTGLNSLQPRGLSGVFSSTTIQKHQFFGAQHSLWPSSHIHTWLLDKP